MSPPPALTPREHEILQLVLQGLSSQAIATRLGLSVHTVRVHRSHFLQKLGARNTAQVVLAAHAAGLQAGGTLPNSRRA